MARRLHANLHRLFRWSVGRGVLERNPMADLPKPGTATRRDRVLGDDEIALIWRRSSPREAEFQMLATALRRIIGDGVSSVQTTKMRETVAEPA